MDASVEKPETSYAQSIDTVIRSEKNYIAERRAQHGLDPPTGDNLVGLCLSGGGIRSATFNLGVLQTLIRKNLLKTVDYLSTVSGGGYIGACLTSLLSGPSDAEDVSPGVETHNSPFTGLRGFDPYTTEPRLSVRHQLHHLRTHGEYLRPHKGLLGHDLQRAIGTVVSGMIHNLALFSFLLLTVVSLTLFCLTFADPDLLTFAPIITPGEPLISGQGLTIEQAANYVLQVLSGWYTVRIEPVFVSILADLPQEFVLWSVTFNFFMLGAGWCIVFLFLAERMIRRIHRAGPADLSEVDSGWNIEDHYESKFIWTFNSLSVVAALLPTLLVASSRSSPSSPYMLAFLLPASFSVGGGLATYLVTNFRASYLARLGRKQDRVRRALFAAVQGACTFGFAAAVVTPIILVLLLALAGLPLKFFVSLAALIVSYQAAKTGSDTTSKLAELLARRKKPLTNLAVLVFLGFAFSWTADLLIDGLRALSGLYGILDLGLMLLVTAAGSGLLLLFGGVVIDSNRISPHYFYRDRLAEAYLKTDARTERLKADRRQGMPLANLRNDENLKLGSLGDGINKPPYHLIVTALNLIGSKELNRKTFLSEHFLFSKNYIGSRVTGWVRTQDYENGQTALARAMTISAAATGSAMGYYSFWAQAFVMTLLNVRLGYWMENPWYHCENENFKRSSWTLWLKYLGLELTGRVTARQPLVNLSDGGHTGDNLGLLPLLQRRCKTIIVCDAEADPGSNFGSFNNAVRMAYIEENIGIEIDLDEIVRKKDTGLGYRCSDASIAYGKITYPARTSDERDMKGELIYIKSSISGKLPVHVSSYLKENPAFPHESTADQFFNDAQFEAYRSLGEHIAGSI